MALPATITLSQPSDHTDAFGSTERSDHAAIQTAVNGIITYLAALAIGGLTGRVNADGTIAAGTGFTVAHPSTGHYTITWTAPFAATPDVQITGFSTTFTSNSWGHNPSTTVCEVYSQTGGIGPVDQAFSFTAQAVA